MTDKTTTNIISRVGYDGASYTHQGWVTDKNWQTTLILVSRPDFSGSTIFTKFFCELRLETLQHETNMHQDDEYDEYDSAGAGADGFPISYFWDITSLEAPVLTGYFRNEYALGIDHNQYMSVLISPINPSAAILASSRMHDLRYVAIY